MKSYILSFITLLCISLIIISGDYLATNFIASQKNDEITQTPLPIHTPAANIQIPKPLQPKIEISDTSDIFIHELEKLGITNITALPKYENSFLFSQFPINKVEHNLSISTTEYRKKLKTLYEEEYMKIHEFTLYDNSLEKAYEIVKKNIENNLINNPEAKIVEVNQYGEKSFVIRLESNQKTMYLVLASGDRLLGIEYLLGENFSRHRSINTVLQTVFPLLQ